MRNIAFSIITLTLASFQSFGQLKVDIYPTEEFMIKNMLMGDSSTTIWNVKFQGPHESRGVFYSKNTVMPIEEGIVLSTGNAIDVAGPNKGTGYTGSNQTKGDQDLHYLAKYKTYDATWISFEFEAVHDLIRFNYIFASEEYPEYVGSTFNDVFGFFLTNLETGEVTNLAVIPNTNKPVTVNNINHKKHSNFYIRNASEKSQQIEFDGLTKPLIAYSKVIPGKKYKIKIGIADVGDDAFDSGVFLQGKSFKSEPVEHFFAENKEYFEAFADKEIVVESRVTKPKTTPTEVKKTNSNTTSNTSKKPEPTNKKPTNRNQDKNTPSSTLDSVIIYFDFDQPFASQSELSKAEKKLKALQIDSYNFYVNGHTDQFGSNSYNQTLSDRRTLFVCNWLKNNFNLKPLKFEGHSFNQLVHTQTTPSARVKNRRVVILYSLK